ANSESLSFISLENVQPRIARIDMNYKRFEPQRHRVHRATNRAHVRMGPLAAFRRQQRRSLCALCLCGSIRFVSSFSVINLSVSVVLDPAAVIFLSVIVQSHCLCGLHFSNQYEYSRALRRLNRSVTGRPTSESSFPSSHATSLRGASARTTADRAATFPSWSS